MSVRAVAATGEVVVNTDTLVTVGLGQVTQITLPKINDGTGATVAVGAHVRVQNTAGGLVIVLGNTGRIVGTVPARSSAVFVARTGLVQSETDGWTFAPVSQTPSAKVTPGAGYLQADSVAIVACLVNNGLMKAE